MLVNNRIEENDIGFKDNLVKIVQYNVMLIYFTEDSYKYRINIAEDGTLSQVNFTAAAYHDNVYTKQKFDNSFSFNENGELVVTIGNVSKTFVPKAEE